MQHCKNLIHRLNFKHTNLNMFPAMSCDLWDDTACFFLNNAFLVVASQEVQKARKGMVINDTLQEGEIWT